MKVDAAGYTDSAQRKLLRECQRLRGYLFDTLTGLPILPWIIEDIRRLIDRHAAAEIVSLALGRSGRDELRIGWRAYDEAVRTVARLLQEMCAAGTWGGEVILCVDGLRSDRFVLVLPGSSQSELQDGAASEEGADRVWAGAQRLASEVGTERFGRLTLAVGRAQVALDPQVRSERAILQAVAEATLASRSEGEPTYAGRCAELSRVIAAGRVRTVFHPVVRLADLEVIGHEALTRPVGELSFESVEELFAFAESTELLLDFELLCCSKAIQAAARLHQPGLLFLNASAPALEGPKWACGTIDRLLAESGFAPTDVVVEITERVDVTRRTGFQRAIEAFRQRGYRVAVDDVGAGHASLEALASLEPDYLKFDASLVRDVDRNPLKRGLIEAMQALAEKMQAQIIAEGVERSEERAALLDLGIALGQGYHFHREAAEWAAADPQGARPDLPWGEGVLGSSDWRRQSTGPARGESR